MVAAIAPGPRRYYQVADVRAWLTDRAPEDIDRDFLAAHTPLPEFHEAARRAARQHYDQELRQSDPDFCRRFRQPKVRKEFRHRIGLGEEQSEV